MSVSAPGIDVHERGFSFLELVVVLAVLGVLLTLAVPSYQQYTRRMHRAEAIEKMLAVAYCQAKIRSITGFYDTSRCTGEGSSEFHEIRLEPPDRTATLEYTIVAEPKKPAGDRCGTLSLDQAGTRGVSGDQASRANCWGGR